MALKPITELINALKGLGLPSVPAARIGDTVPKLPGELPTVRVVASDLMFSPLGIGGSRSLRKDALANLVEESGRRITGIIKVEAWGDDEDAVNMIALAAAEGLAGIESQLRGQGFLRLRQSRWQAAEEAPLRGTPEPHRKALRQALAYDIVFEDMVSVAPGEGIISVVEVRIQPPVGEELKVTEPAPGP
jgi:hypothetical protein